MRRYMDGATVGEGKSTVDDRAAQLRRQVFAATWWSYAGFYVTRKVFSVVKGPVMRVLHTDDLSVSHLWTVYLTTYSLGMFVAAALSSRMRCRSQLIFGMTLSVLANAATAMLLPLGAVAYWPLFACFAVHGLAQSVGWPNNVAIVGRWTHRHERGSVMGVWCTCYQIGSVFAKALAAYSYAHVGLSGAFWVSALVMSIITLAFLRFGHEDPASHGIAYDDSPLESSKDATSADASTPTKALPASVIVGCMGMLYFGFKFLRYALDSWTPRLLEDRFALGASEAGYVSTAFDWVGFLGVLAAGYASDRYFRSRRLPVIAIMAVAMALVSILMVTVGMTAVPVFSLLLGLVGFAAMGPDSLLSGVAAVDAADPKVAARTVAIVNGLGSIGPILQEPAIGYLKTHYGIEAVFALLAVVSVLTAAGAMTFLSVTRRRGLHL